VPTKPISSLTWTPTGSRPTALTTGLLPRLSRRRGRAMRKGCSVAWSSDKRSRTQLGTDSDRVGDEPPPIDPGDLLARRGDRHDLARLEVDMVALEVERPFVAVDRLPDLVRGRVEEPLVLRVGHLRDIGPEMPDLLLPCQRLAGSGSERGVRRPQAH